MSLVSLTDYRPMPRYDGKAWTGARVESAAVSEGPWSIIDTMPFAEPEPDPAKPIERNFTIRVEDPAVAWLRIVFVDDDGEQDVTSPVLTSGMTAELATVQDVGKRLGRYLNENEEVQVASLITSATQSIFTAVDKDHSYEPPPDVREFLSGLCIELVCRSMPNPHALFSQSETLGAHSVSQMFSRDIAGGGLMLLPAEELAARRKVWGTNNGSSRTRSMATDVADIRYGEDITTSEDTPSNGNGSGTGTPGPAGPPGPPGPAGQAGPPGPAVIRSRAEFQFNAATTAPPASGQARLNNVNQGAATKLFLSVFNADGVDIENLMDPNAVPLGPQQPFVYIQDKDNNGNWQHYHSTLVTLHPGSYAEYDITWDDGGNPVTVSTGQKRVVVTLTGEVTAD